MIEMTPEVKKQLLNLGRDALERKDPNKMLKNLFENSLKVMKKLGKRELPDCKICYKYPDELSDKYSPELFSWATVLICMRWNLYLLKQKAIEGHCYTHKLPCPQSQKFHDELFNEAKKSFEEIVKHDYEKEIKNEGGESDNKDKKIILITRTFGRPKVKDFVERFYKNNNKELFEKIIVLVNCEEETDYYTQTLLSRIKDDEIFNRLEIVHVKPWGVASGALNIGLMKAYNREEKPDQILIASPEVELEETHVKKMSDTLTTYPNMLVVGYALEASEKGHIKDKEACDALRVPWNTCAMWDADLFFKNVGAFNIICDCPNYLGDKLQGMEDALAIALAQSNDSSLEIGMIWKGRPKWGVDIKDKQKHEDKMGRKSNVYTWYKNKFKKIKKLRIENITDF